MLTMKKKGKLLVVEPDTLLPSSTAELIERSRKGDRQAFKELVERYQRLVAMIVFRIVPRQEDGRDVCQEVFLKVFEHLGDYRAESEFSTWIGRIARNTAINQIMKKRTPVFSEFSSSPQAFENIAGCGSSPESCCEESQVQAKLEEGVASLPEKDRVMLTLFHQEGMDYESIGRVLDLPLSSVKSRLFRARKKLRERLVGLVAVREVS